MSMATPPGVILGYEDTALLISGRYLQLQPDCQAVCQVSLFKQEQCTPTCQHLDLAKLHVSTTWAPHTLTWHPGRGQLRLPGLT